MVTSKNPEIRDLQKRLDICEHQCTELHHIMAGLVLDFSKLMRELPVSREEPAPAAETVPVSRTHHSGSCRIIKFRQAVN